MLRKVFSSKCFQSPVRTGLGIAPKASGNAEVPLLASLKHCPALAIQIIKEDLKLEYPHVLEGVMREAKSVTCHVLLVPRDSLVPMACSALPVLQGQRHPKKERRLLANVTVLLVAIPLP